MHNLFDLVFSYIKIAQNGMWYIQYTELANLLILLM